jgi:hypothetical protein
MKIDYLGNLFRNCTEKTLVLISNDCDVSLIKTGVKLDDEFPKIAFN